MVSSPACWASRRNLHKYFTVFITTLKDFKEYRSQFYLTYIGWFTRLVIIVFLWKAIFEGKSHIGHYDFKDALTYFMLTQIGMSFIFSHVGFHYARDIVSGDLSNYLHRPISYPLYKLVFELGRNIARTFIGIISYGIMIIIFAKYFSFHFSWTILPLALLSFILGFLINHCMTALVGILSFWFTDTTRLIYIYFSIVTIFAGLTVPLDLFPEKMYTILKFTPLPYSFFIPVKILQNTYQGQELLENVLAQIFFTVILIGITIASYRLGLKKYEAVGK